MYFLFAEEEFIIYTGFYRIQIECRGNMREFTDRLEEMEATLPVSIAEERFEPAVVSVGSFLQGYCVHLAKALRAKCGLPAFALVDRGGELVHAYNIKWTPDEGKLYFDARGITDRSDLFIEPFQGLPDLKETALDTVLETVPQWTFMEDEVSDAMVRWFVENYTDIWRMKENKDSPID